MSELRVTELDFKEIKENLKSFLQSQEEFADYDFDGAGLSVLLDILAYNTHYNAMLAHLQANEMFIDTAIKRSSIVSIAKTLGYTPRSSVCSRARANLTFVPTDNTTTVYTITPELKFTGSVNGTTFTFNVTQQQTQTSTDGVFTFNDVELYEGTRITNTFVVAPDTRSGPFVIPNDEIDISTVNVVVQTSATELTQQAYRRSTTIVDVAGDDKVFWIEENPAGKYQIVFGDDIIGKQLEDKNIVFIEYISCNGSNSNGVNVLTLASSIDDATLTAIEVVNKSASGAFREGIDEIRFNAPKYNATRNRAVTSQDYKSLILAEFARAKSVAVWGGEQNDPPIYGKVFITLDPKDGEIITESDKDFIIEQILRPRSVMSIQHEFVDPDYLHIGFNIDVKYNSRNTTLTPSQIQAIVIQGVSEYFTSNLETLERPFIYSQFVDFIQNLLPERIVGVLADMKLQRRIDDIVFGQFTTKTTRFLTQLIPETLRSSNFTTELNGREYTVFIKDFGNSDTIDFKGTGTLKLIDLDTNVILSDNVGSVNYNTGVVTIQNLTITSYFGEATELRLNVSPQELGKNISPTVIPMREASQFATSPLPSKNSILLLDDTEADTLSNTTPGLTVRVTPFISNT
jgi:hypothetical protein